MKKRKALLLSRILFLFFSYNLSAEALQTINTGYLNIGIQNIPSCAITHFFSDIAKSEGLKIKWHRGPFENAAEGMKNRLFDVSAHGISTINRAAPKNALASNPYLSVQRGFTVLKKSPLANAGRLPKNSQVAVMNHSTALEDIQTNYLPEHFKLTLIEKLKGSARANLRSEKFDAIAEGYTGFWFNPEDAQDMKMIDVHPLYANQPNAEGLAFWVQHDEKVLLQVINDYLEELGGNIYQYYQEKGICDTHYVFPES